MDIGEEIREVDAPRAFGIEGRPEHRRCIPAAAFFLRREDRADPERAERPFAAA